VAMNDQSVGGDDRLISGTGSDHMWGDAQYINEIEVLSPATDTGLVQTGADTFVFGSGNGEDFVYDFRQGDHDRIDVSAYGLHSLADMTISAVGGDTKIAFDANDSVTLVGFGDPGTLHPWDFIFA
jgi:Ca2+-binding RTX toxin-like protein